MKNSLPIDSILTELNQALSQDNNVILSAQPGAGKTTRVPLALLDADWLKDTQNKNTGFKKILMLEPRRLAARNAAMFMAKSLGEDVGQTVGYRMRQDSKVSKHTRIEVITEGILTRLLLQDPELNDVGLIIFDEHHERSINTDLGLALSLQCQQLFRDDLKLLVMSATLDKDALEDMLGAKTVFCAGRVFPIEYHYLGFDNKQRLNTQMTTAILTALNKESGSILAFLPGVRDILQVQQDLQHALQEEISGNKISIHPLYGQLSDKEQQLAIQPADVNYHKDHRKIVLATNIAESSLTIEGIRIVVDSGLEKQLTYNARSEMNALMTKKTSQASATQRAGRAGRIETGVAYRLWNEQQQNRLEAHSPAEISRIELSDLVLNVAQWGAEVEDLDWLTTPPKRAVHQAQSLLNKLELLNDSGQITRHGEQASQLGLSPRFAHMLLLAASNAEIKNQANNQTLKDASLLAAILTDTPKALRNNDDLNSLLQQANAQNNSFKTLHRQADVWVKKIQSLNAPFHIQHEQKHFSIAQLLALAFPDRLAKKRSSQNLSSQNLSSQNLSSQTLNNQGNQFLLSSGRGAKLHVSSALNRFDWLIVTDIEDDQQGGSIIRKAMAITESELFEALDTHIQQKNHIQWNNKGQLEAEVQDLLGAIIIQRKKITNLSPNDWQDAWYNYFKDNGISHSTNSKLPWTPECLQLQARLQLGHQYLSSKQPSSTQAVSAWPDFSDNALLADIKQWLIPLLTDIRSEKALKNIDLKQALTNRLGWDKTEEFKQLIPEKLQVPSGSFYHIDYLQHPPVLAVKLQEMFGYQGSPSILNGKVKLMIHLLSPARRTLQITQDLPHFWASSYFDVRKDMRGRYPKHNWPENPLESEATRFTKHAKKQ